MNNVKHIFVTIFMVAIVLATALNAADGSDPCDNDAQIARRMQERIDAQQERINQMECELLMRHNGQLCLESFSLCFKNYMHCRETIMKEKKKKYPEMYSYPGRYFYRR